MADFVEFFAPDPMERNQKCFGYQMPENYDPEPKNASPASPTTSIRLKALGELFATESQDL
ncbi:hypothetical protein AC578_1378 [Pseudocercospora eumusae]|uniref:Uncharacterized protein n=1 Tax=Pseudocercospora eumusae TaxID=321146 RepID=A0A139HUL1_9PEZI|nr:hypothetical protein AC578_1378 [Pseudocercospora eumusae]